MMNFRAKLLLKVNDKWKQSNKLYNLIVTKDMVCFKGALFKRSIINPEKAIVGKSIVRVQHGSRNFHCRFIDRLSLQNFVKALKSINVIVIDCYELTQQESIMELRIDYCKKFIKSSEYTSTIQQVESTLNRAIWSPIDKL